MVTLFFIGFIALVLAELVKGLSANGTPPVLQKYAWQLDLAHFMWSHIKKIRIVLAAVLILMFLSLSGEQRSIGVIIGAILLGLLWALIYWVFHHYWVGRVKFQPLKNPVFKTALANKIDTKTPIIGIDLNGKQKAYPVSMLFYHHQLADQLDDQALWVTYCGLCRSGRIFDRSVDGKALEFELVGAITFNAVFKDFQTNSWWRQETGEAVKGPSSGKELADIPFEQMSLEHWLAKYPESEILQHDPEFQKQYMMRDRMMNYEASLPGWHMQETPSLIIGVEVGGDARAYDWDEMKKRRMVMDDLASTPLLVLSSKDESYAFVYDRCVEGEVLGFEFNDEVLTDIKTGSEWNQFGQCISGDMSGSSLATIQSYQQYVRAWVSFHSNTSFYDFK